MNHQSGSNTSVIEVFAEVTCPFAHVGLRRFVDRRDELGRDDVVLAVRAWPLEIVNGQAIDRHHIAGVIGEIRRQIAPTLFDGFVEASVPASSLGALALAAAAYEQSLETGEMVSLALRDLLFECGVDIGDVGVLEDLAARHGISVDLTDIRGVHRDHERGMALEVIGSPHFFTPAGDFFCPALDVHRDADGILDIRPNAQRFERFITACLG